MHEKSRPAGGPVGARSRHLDLAVHDHEPGPLVYLVVRKAFARAEVERDYPRVIVR
jgi:hypothetical protein